MTAGEHSCTRRALLGAAVGVPLLAGAEAGGGALVAAGSSGQSVPLPEARAATEWARRLAAFRRAEGAVARFEASGVEDDDRFDALLDRLYPALRRLLRAPAPDWAALAAKIVLVADHEVATLAGGEACMAAVRADAVRLGGEGRA